MDEDEKKMLFNEINNLKDLDHPNILKMYEFFEDEKRYYYYLQCFLKPAGAENAAAGT